MAKRNRFLTPEMITEAVRQSFRQLHEGKGDTALINESAATSSWAALSDYLNGGDISDENALVEMLDENAPLEFDVDYTPGYSATYDEPGDSSEMHISSAKISRKTIEKLVSFLQNYDFSEFVEDSTSDLEQLRQDRDVDQDEFYGRDEDDYRNR